MANRGGIKYIWGPMRTLLRNIPENRVLLGLSIATGALSGLAAVILKWAIHFIQGQLANLHADTPWAYILLPGVGMLLSLLIVRYLIKDNIGHGVTKVLQAVSKNESRIKNHNCWSSIVTSALTIGFGGSQGTSGDDPQFSWDPEIDPNDIAMFWNSYDETDLAEIDKDHNMYISKAEFDTWFESIGGSW